MGRQNVSTAGSPSLYCTEDITLTVVRYKCTKYELFWLDQYCNVNMVGRRLSHIFVMELVLTCNWADWDTTPYMRPYVFFVCCFCCNDTFWLSHDSNPYTSSTKCDYSHLYAGLPILQLFVPELSLTTVLLPYCCQIGIFLLDPVWIKPYFLFAITLLTVIFIIYNDVYTMIDQ